jgi:hypothetical protein
MDRHQSSPHNELTTSPTEETNHRRAYTQPVGGTLLPPLPPLQSSSHPNHPSFSPDFYPSYSPHAASTSAPAGLHMAGYPNEPMSAPQYQGHYSDPRHPGGAGPTDRYQSSPHNELTTSSTEETNHRRAYTQPVGGTLLPPLPPLQSSSHANHPSFSPDFYPSYSPHAASTSAPAGLHMAGYLNEPMSAPLPAGQGGYQYQLTSPLNQPTQMRGEESEDQPYGLPQDEYKALNPRDKKKVRNRWVGRCAVSDRS